jgi:hypothetical protein
VGKSTDSVPRRGQLAVNHLQSLACAHVPFVARLVNAYQVASGDPFAFEVGESDLPFWFAQTAGQWIGILLVPYTTFDQYPYLRDFSGTRSIFGVATEDSLRAALAEEPFPDQIEMLDAWSLFYRGKYAEAIRMLATSVEIALEQVFRNLLAGKGYPEEQIAKRLETTFNDFDGRLEDYLRASDRRQPGPILSIIPYINGVRLLNELNRNRRLRHKVVHEGRRFDRSMAGDMQRAMETTTWLFRWLVNNEDKPPKLLGDKNSLISSLRCRPMYTWSYTPDCVLIDDPSKHYKTEGNSSNGSSGIAEEMRHHQFMTSVDGENQDLELFVRMFFEYIGLDAADAPLPPRSVTCEYERYLVYSWEGRRVIPIFLFDLEELPTLAHLHAVAARLLMRGNAPDQRPKAICIFNIQKGAPWRLREDTFIDDAFLSLAQQCGITICSTVDMLLVIDAAKRYRWACRPIADAVFQPGRILAAPPGYEPVGTVNQYYEGRKALSIAVAAGAELRRGDTVVVRLKNRYHEQRVESLEYKKQPVQVVAGPANAGVGADLDRAHVFEEERGRVFVNGRKRPAPSALSPTSPPSAPTSGERTTGT